MLEAYVGLSIFVCVAVLVHAAVRLSLWVEERRKRGGYYYNAKDTAIAARNFLLSLALIFLFPLWPVAAALAGPYFGFIGLRAAVRDFRGVND